MNILCIMSWQGWRYTIFLVGIVVTHNLSTEHSNCITVKQISSIFFPNIRQSYKNLPWIWPCGWIRVVCAEILSDRLLNQRALKHYIIIFESNDKSSHYTNDSERISVYMIFISCICFISQKLLLFKKKKIKKISIHIMKNWKQTWN